MSKTDFALTDINQQSIVIDVPRAIVKNRWAAKINGKITAIAEGTEILWTVEGLGDKHYEHLVTIADQLPDGTLFDHGIPDAVDKLSNKMFGRKEIRHLANLLDRGELVLAMGVGLFSKKMGAVAITNKRLIFLEKSMLGSESLTEFSLNSIGAMSIGKKMGGETLSITHSGTTALISGMGHGQADSIARAFRQLKEQPAADSRPSPQDPMAQLERLGELHAKGILTDEEFQAQKAQILSRM
ncbi:PH domain-containing protein [Paeniglutamicibacter sp. ORCA_105]|uniref:PH domain-containing protein n=1 Tax=Paeniglutamicibacter sp. ORCA_105 TaxID=3377336 RepID=UPI003895F580